MILYLDVRIFLLDGAGEFPEHCRASDTGHILEADFIAAVFYDLVHHSHIIFYRMDRRVGDGKRHLGYHASFLGIFYRKPEVPVVIQSAERT